MNEIQFVAINEKGNTECTNISGTQKIFECGKLLFYISSAELIAVAHSAWSKYVDPFPMV